MRIFGCDAYKQIPKEQRRKLDPKSEKMVFVGYEDESTNYRLWDTRTKKIHVSCNVIFNEMKEDLSHVKEELKKETTFHLSFREADHRELEENIATSEGEDQLEKRRENIEVREVEPTLDSYEIMIRFVNRIATPNLDTHLPLIPYLRHTRVRSKVLNANTGKKQ